MEDELELAEFFLSSLLLPSFTVERLP